MSCANPPAAGAALKAAAASAAAPAAEAVADRRQRSADDCCREPASEAATAAEPRPAAASGSRGGRGREGRGHADAAPAETLAPAERRRASRARPDIETALGTRWAVWVGGLALALGGLFLIRYSIEAGIFGPGVRLTMAGLLGLVLVGGGEFIRRTGFKVPVEGAAGAYVPGILTAAGAFTLFGTVYAAHGIYGFIGPAAAFLLLGVIGVAHDRRRAGPWPGAGRHRPARLDGHAGAGLLAGAERLGAVRLSGDRAGRQHRRSRGMRDWKFLAAAGFVGTGAVDAALHERGADRRIFTVVDVHHAGDARRAGLRLARRRGEGDATGFDWPSIAPGLLRRADGGICCSSIPNIRRSAASPTARC